MFIKIANQQKLDELREYLDSLPLDITHTIEGFGFPMVANFRLAPERSDQVIFVSEDDSTWMPYSEWFKGVEDYLMNHFGAFDCVNDLLDCCW